MNEAMSYRGYINSIIFDADDKIIVGKAVNIGPPASNSKANSALLGDAEKFNFVTF